LRGSRALALDSESDSLYHHFEKVCLLQIAAEGGEEWLVDTLVLKDLGALAPVLADPSVVKVLHGADYDVVTLKRDFGFAFDGLFDTMIAARFLGLPQIGLQALVHAELGVVLSKHAQTDDWSRRPLSPAQEAYARADVRHLLALYARLEARLRERGRLDRVIEECAAVAGLPPAHRRPDPEAYQRVKGARRLSRRALAVLRELHAWREGRAEATDVPPFRILGNEALLAMAEAPPRTVEDVGRMRGVSPRLRKHAPDLLNAVERALAVPEAQLPVVPAAPRPVVPEPVRRRVEALKAWRAQEAAREGLDVSVVLPQRLIDAVAEIAPRDLDGLSAVPGLRRWRVEAYGTGILAALS
jgi:ribonuclease D